jgi:hypothetical protein
MLSFGAIYAGAGDGEELASEEKTFKEKLKDVFTNEEDDDEELLEEEKGFPLSLGLDLVSRYVWRGIDFGASPAIQPFLEYSVGNDLVTWGAGAWGSYAFTGSVASEFDLYSYLSVGPVTVNFTDYFFPGEVWGGDKYFSYTPKHGTGHVYELMVSAGSDDFPIYGTAAVNLGGADQSYSSYFEVGATLYDGIDLYVGMAYDNYTGYYLAKGKQKFNVINVGLTASHDIEVKKLSIPISASVIFNPEARNVWFVAAIGLSN